jgi:hypothetical protein
VHLLQAAKEAQRVAAKLAAARSKTFQQCAEAYIATHKDGWTPLYAAQWSDTLARFAYPIIGDLPVADIDRALVKRVLAPIWTSKPVTAKAVMQHMAKVLGWAVAEGLQPDTYNPAAWRDFVRHFGNVSCNVARAFRRKYRAGQKTRHRAHVRRRKADAQILEEDCSDGPENPRKAIEYTVRPSLAQRTKASFTHFGTWVVIGTSSVLAMVLNRCSPYIEVGIG